MQIYAVSCSSFWMQWCLDVHLLMVHLEPSDIAHWYYAHHWNGYLGGCKPWRSLHCMLHLYCSLSHYFSEFMHLFQDFFHQQQGREFLSRSTRIPTYHESYREWSRETLGLDL